MMRSPGARCHGERGSIMPLAIGCTTIAIALIMLAAVISDIYLAHRKLYALADSAALAATDSFEPDYGADPGILLTDAAVREEALEYLRRAGPTQRFDRVGLDASSPDGLGARITLTARYRPALISPFVPDGIEMSATATARGALREG